MSGQRPAAAGERQTVDVVEHPDLGSCQRVWHPRMGLGWLVHPPVSERGAIVARFEPDEGTPVDFRWVEVSVGRPEYARKLKRARTRAPRHGPDEMHWSTYTTTDEEMLTFRRGGPPPKDAAEEPSGAQGVLL